MLYVPLALVLAGTPAPFATELETSLLPSNVAELMRAAPSVQEAEKPAAVFSYTYFEVGGGQYDVDAISEKSDIYFARGSLELFKLFYIFGEYQNQASDFANTDVNLYQLGVGAHFTLGKRFDVFGEVGWLYNDLSSDVAQLDDTTDGYEAFLGGRFMLLPWDGGGLELNGGVGYVDLENRLASDDAATEWEIGARVHFLRLLSVGATYSVLKDDDMALFGIRASF